MKTKIDYLNEMCMILFAKGYLFSPASFTRMRSFRKQDFVTLADVLRYSKFPVFLVYLRQYDLCLMELDNEDN